MIKTFTLTLALTLLGCGSTLASTTPTTIIVPYAPGAAGDMAVKHFQKYIQQKKNINSITLYKPGAEGVIGLTELNKLPVDGKTFAYANVGTLAEIEKKSNNLNFELVTAVHESTMCLVTNQNTGVKSLQEAEDYLKTKKDIKFGHGTVSQKIYIELFLKKAKSSNNEIFVPYKGGAPTLNDLMGGHIDFAFIPAMTVATLLNSGKINIVACDSKINGFKQQQTLNDRYPDWQGYSVNGFVFSKGTSPEIIEYWRKVIYEYLADPEVKRELENDYMFKYVPTGQKFFKEAINRVP